MKSMALLALKQEGHDLIDKLVEMGTQRTRVYEKLAKRLKRPHGMEHFANMETEEECNQAIHALRSLIAYKIEADTPKIREIGKLSKSERRRARKGVVLPHDQMQQAFAALKARRQAYDRLPWYDKLWRKIIK